MRIGEMKNGSPVTISPSSPNEHILLVGTSGSGKSTRISEMLEDCLGKHETVVVIDINGCDFCHNAERKNIISAMDDGLNLSLLDTGMIHSRGEEYINSVSYIVENFSAIVNLGIRQIGALREAVIYALENYSNYDNDMAAIAEGLRLQDSDIAAGVYNKMWGLLNCPVFNRKAKQMKAGYLNVISLKGLNPSVQKQIADLILMKLWQRSRLQDENCNGLRIVLDEFQNLTLKKNSVIQEMLREARKYGIKMILATQSVANLPKEVVVAIGQTAVQLYFRQATSDVKKITEFIDPQQRERWTLILKRLAIGESVATGDFLVNGKEVCQPIVIKSAFGRFSENHVNHKLTRSQGRGE